MKAIKLLMILVIFNGLALASNIEKKLYSKKEFKEEVIKELARNLRRLGKGNIMSQEDKKFPPLSIDQLNEILGLTIKSDNNNKIITFLSLLSAFTDNNQFNISFNAPSSSGKSYIPLEISSLFPKEDVRCIGHASPTSFFHEEGPGRSPSGVRGTTARLPSART